MTGELAQYRDWLIQTGIKEIEETYPEDDPKRVGGLAGFEACQNIDGLVAFEAAIKAGEEIESTMRTAHMLGDASWDEKAYWIQRSSTIQIEFVYKRILVAAGLTKTASVGELESLKRFLNERS